MKDLSIKLNDQIAINLPKLIVSKLLAVANSGGGKSWLIRRIVEQAYGKVQIIIIDPEGEFTSLREKYDFILCGKGMDAPAESRSAALLARKLLESKSSAIIDLYELHPQDRKHFVKLFFDSMINAPKELYNDCLVVLDEAHKFAPEKEESEALYSVIEMASLGRKRGFCLIPVTQRISKLSKDVAAECNNKLMGRASLDLDRKRTADELGISNKDEILALRNLQPGEFFAFGPAISHEVIRLKVGEVFTTIPKAGRQTKVAPPSERVKKELAALRDLPAEAEKEAKTVAELKKVNADLLRKIGHNPQKIVESDPKMIEKAIKETERRMNIEFMAERDEFLKHIGTMFKVIETVAHTVKDIKMPDFKKREVAMKEIYKIFGIPVYTSDEVPKGTFKMDQIVTSKIPKEPAEIRVPETITPLVNSDAQVSQVNFGICEKAIYSFLYARPRVAWSKTQVAVATLYSRNSGGFDNAISKLSARGLIAKADGGLTILAASDRHEELIIPIDVSLGKWSAKLGACPRKIWDMMLEGYMTTGNKESTKTFIADRTGYSIKSGGFDNGLSKLSALGLIVRLPGGLVKINPELISLLE